MNYLGRKKEISRRNFIGMATGTAGMAMLGGTAISGWAQNHSNVKAADLSKREYETDVLVIGGGMAGLFAAVKAYDAGANVVMVSKGRLGSSGQTPFAKGIFAYDAKNEEMSLDEFTAKVSASALGTNTTKTGRHGLIFLKVRMVQSNSKNKHLAPGQQRTTTKYDSNNNNNNNRYMRIFTRTILLLILALTLTFCTGKKKKDSVALTEQTHGKYAKPNYSIVFPNDKVNRIDIKIDLTNWNEMMVDLQSNFGSFARMQPRPGNEEDRNLGFPQQNNAENPHQQRNHPGPPARRMGMSRDMENDSLHSQNGEQRMGPPPGGMLGGTPYEPVWEYCDVLFNNEKWSKVGIRFKGNSSLRMAYQSGINKLSFKLDFEQFETEFPEIKNQRFYGFKQLNLKNNYDDKSFIREKVASDLFADFGLVSPKTSFCQVFVDYGDGPTYFGLYTLVEEVDDTVIETAFSSENGNLYKPEGRAATFANNSFRDTDMNKKNNKKSNDYSDVQQLTTVINSSLRIENHELWKTQLNDIFDVPVFLKWLAANTVMQNWDTYGKSIHNYYLYNNPANNKLVWIPWDNNEAFQPGKMGGAPSLSLNEIGENWPLIRYILEDEQWNSEYKRNVSEFAGNFFAPERMTEIYSDCQQLLENYTIGNQGEIQGYTFLRNKSDFTEAFDYLNNHVNARNTAVLEFLNN